MKETNRKNPTEARSKHKGTEPVESSKDQTTEEVKYPDAETLSEEEEVMTSDPDLSQTIGSSVPSGVYCTSLKCTRDLQLEKSLFDPHHYQSIMSPGPLASLSAGYRERVASIAEDNEPKHEEDREAAAAAPGGQDGNDPRRRGSIGFDPGRVRRSVPSLTDERRRSEDAGVGGVRRNSLLAEQLSELRFNSAVRGLLEAAVSAAATTGAASSSFHRQSPSVAGQPSLQAVDELPAEYPFDDDDEPERLIWTQYYDEEDQPADDAPLLEGRVGEAGAGGPLRIPEIVINQSDSTTLETVIIGGEEYELSQVELGEITTGCTTRSRLRGAKSDSAPSLPRVDQGTAAAAVAESGETLSQKETRSKSRIAVVSKAPSLRAITEELQRSPGNKEEIQSGEERGNETEEDGGGGKVAACSHGCVEKSRTPEIPHSRKSSLEIVLGTSTKKFPIKIPIKIPPL